jgi:type IV pilus assembly protein PilQ
MVSCSLKSITKTHRLLIKQLTFRMAHWGDSRGLARGRRTICLVAWMTLCLSISLPVGAQHFSSITVPGPDPNFTPPQMPIQYKSPDEKAATQSESAPQKQTRRSPWAAQALDALQSVVEGEESVTVNVTETAAPAAPPTVASQVEIIETPPPVGATLTTSGPKQHHLPMGQQVPKDIMIKEDQGLISLMVRDAPLKQVIALVAETQKLNIVFASTTNVPVTASFDRVPFEQVIEALLSISGHTWTINEDIIFITEIDAADYVSPEAGGRIVEVFELDFASAVDVDQAVQGLLSPAGQSWVLESSTEDNRRTREVVAVVDYPANMSRISDYICQVDQPPRQVLIEANILEVELSDDCKNGINFNNLLSISGASGNNIRLQSAGFANPAAPTAFFMHVTGGDLDGIVELLKNTVDAKSLASPKVLSVSGQESQLQTGSQLGFRVTTTTQTGTFESIQMLDVGTILKVTPRITRDGRVMMKIKPEVSTGSIDPGTGLPSKDTTNVETDVLLNDGQGMVIGGLIQEADSITSSKIPYIADLPYVGILFQKRQVIKRRSEIVVTLIPHIQPYHPVIADREAAEFARTEDRLTYGALHRNPRPYEPKLYDTFVNPRRPIANLAAIHRAKRNGELYPQTSDMISFPPLESPEFHPLPAVEDYPETEQIPAIAFPVEQTSFNDSNSTPLR